MNKSENKETFVIREEGRYIITNGEVLKIEKNLEINEKINQIMIKKNSNCEKIESQEQENQRQQQKKFVVCTDLDDTLVKHKDKAQTKKFKDFYLKNFILNKNVVLVYSTGRGLSTFEQLQHDYGLLTPNYLILACGSQIIDTIKYFDENKKQYHVSEEFVGYLDQKWDQKLYFKEIYNRFDDWVDPNPYEKSDDHRICLKISQENFDQFSGQLKKLVEEEFETKNVKGQLIHSGSHGYQYCDILPIHGGKGNALKFLCEKIIKIPVELSVCFGDSTNDVQQLEMAGEGVIVKNASQDLMQWYLENKDKKCSLILSDYEHSQALIEYLNFKLLYNEQQKQEMVIFKQNQKQKEFEQLTMKKQEEELIQQQKILQFIQQTEQLKIQNQQNKKSNNDDTEDMELF